MKDDKKITAEQAEAEVSAWLDRRKVYPETRARYKDSIEILEHALIHGDITIDEKTGEIHHTLLFPLNGDDGSAKDLGVEKFKYKPRMNDKLMRSHLVGVKSDDGDGRLQALIGALTDQPRGIITSIDSADKRIATAIGIFFM
jgi:hypothetical protein